MAGRPRDRRRAAQRSFPDVFGASTPEALKTYLAVAAPARRDVAGLTMAVARGRELPLATAAWSAPRPAAPLLVLVVAYAGSRRRTAASPSPSPQRPRAGFAAAAGWLAAGGGRRARSTARGSRSATAAGALAALALGLTFALDKGMLTVAFALMALGTAWVAARIALPVLRYVGRRDRPRRARPLDLGPDHRRRRPRRGLPILNWLRGYGVPALSFLARPPPRGRAAGTG